MMRMKRDSGEVMIEGLIIVILTVFLLLWILAVGFLHYQRYIVTAVVNDAAKKVAATYNNPTSDMVMGFIQVEDLSARDLYRGVESQSLQIANYGRTKSYIEYMLKKLGTSDMIDNINIELNFISDNISSSRGHVVLKATCRFNTPIGEALDFFGMSKLVGYECEAYAECQDLANYISTADFMSGMTKPFDETKTAKMINSVFKLFYTHAYQES